MGYSTHFHTPSVDDDGGGGGSCRSTTGQVEEKKALSCWSGPRIGRRAVIMLMMMTGPGKINDCY